MRILLYIHIYIYIKYEKEIGTQTFGMNSLFFHFKLEYDLDLIKIGN